MTTNIERGARRRVPDALRKRALISCDRCKAKRSRCIRSDQSEACTSCLAAGFRCESTMPRKQRLYGSVEGLSMRYRTLDAFVKGLFPTENTNDTDVIRRLARENNIHLPTTSTDGFDVRVDEPCDKLKTPGTMPPSDAHQDTKANKSTTEKLIPAPHGVPHYIGPASTFEFAAALRQLVAKYNSMVKPTANQADQSQVRAEFADMKISIALEPRVHPTAVAEDNDEIEDSEKSFAPSHRTDIHPETPSVTSPGSSVVTRAQRLIDILPSRMISDELLQAYFDRAHPNYILFHRGLFQAQYESIWQEDYDPPDPGWGCCLHMILAFGAQVSETLSPEQAILIQKRSVREVRKNFHHLTFTANLSNIQALLLLQIFEYNAGERNTAWLHLGLAARMAVALGMHREGTSRIFEPIHRNVRKIVWFTLYNFECHVSIALGRPSIIDSGEVDVGLPEQNLMDGGDLPPDYMHYSMRLAKLSIRIRGFVPLVSSALADTSQLLLTCPEGEKLLQEFESWVVDLPRHLQLDCQSFSPRHRRAIVLMHIHHQHLKSVALRPYLLYTANWHMENSLSGAHVDTSTSNLRIRGLSLSCSQSASSIAECLELMANEDLFDGVTWLDFYYVYHNILIMSLVIFWHQHDPELLHNSYARVASAIQSMLFMCYRNRLAQTYQILLRVAFQFANIVGVGLDNTSTELKESEDGSSPRNNTEMPGQSTIPAVFMTDPFAQFTDTQGLYYSGNDGLDADLLRFDSGLDYPEWASIQYFPPPAETLGEPGLMVYGQSNSWRAQDHSIDEHTT